MGEDTITASIMEKIKLIFIMLIDSIVFSVNKLKKVNEMIVESENRDTNKEESNNKTVNILMNVEKNIPIPKNVKKSMFKKYESEIMRDIERGYTYREICEQHEWNLSSFKSFMAKRREKHEIV